MKTDIALNCAAAVLSFLVGSQGSASAAEPCLAVQDSFKATQNVMPTIGGGGHTLRVDGQATCSNGFRPFLVKPAQQGTDSSTIILEVDAKPPATSRRSRLKRTIAVTPYSHAESDVTQVTIHGAGADFTIPVKQLH